MNTTKPEFKIEITDNGTGRVISWESEFQTGTDVKVKQEKKSWFSRLFSGRNLKLNK